MKFELQSHMELAPGEKAQIGGRSQRKEWEREADLQRKQIDSTCL